MAEEDGLTLGIGRPIADYGAQRMALPPQLAPSVIQRLELTISTYSVTAPGPKGARFFR